MLLLQLDSCLDLVVFGQMFAPHPMQKGVADDTRNATICFVVCLQAVKKRKDLKLIVTSATLDAVKFSQYFFESVSGLEIILIQSCSRAESMCLFSSNQKC